MNNINEIKEDICRLRDPQSDGWIDKILLKLDELQPFLKTPKEELLIELGNKLMNNLVLLDERIIGTDKFPEHKDAFGELLEIIGKIREME